MARFLGRRKALLETEELIVRGSALAKLAFSDEQQIAAGGGVLHVCWGDHDSSDAIAALRSPLSPLRSHTEKLVIPVSKR